MRTKLESSQPGGHFIHGTKVVQIPYDGMQLGSKSVHLSCSDKIAKRCVIGVQGALLTQLIPPLYMTGIVIGDKFSHGSVARSLCCRSQIALAGSQLSPSSIFDLHHLKIGHWPLNTKRCDQVNKARTKISMNWMSGDKNMEALDATTGRLENNNSSRISKDALFRNFQLLCEPARSPSCTYRENKQLSKEYQQAKQIWIEAMSRRFKTGWCAKPSEVDEFLCVDRN
mmetsp:Transcript_50314/g.75750  ORF Transcript_50314/g.75750 Transcript_50314/m.75750 type:complete len:227 (-) Transcript_50314:844-1524(-)